MILVALFFSFFQIGLFSFGGGYAALPLIQNQVVDLHGWLSQAEFTDLVTISQMTPGPIAINAATFVGIQVAGFPGAVVSTLGCVFPSCIIVSILARLYEKYRELGAIKGVLNGLRPAVVALILSAGVSMLGVALFGESMQIRFHPEEFVAIALFLIAFFIIRKYKWNPVMVIGACGIVGGAAYYFIEYMGY